MRRHLIHTASLGLVLAIGAFFVASVPLRPAMWPVSLLAILLFSAPVFFGCIRWLGWRSGLFLMAVLGVYALAFETFAVVTGVPYGRFAYGELLGPQLFGTTPASVLVAWSPLVLGVIAVLPRLGPVRRIALGTVLLVAVDLVLDPAAVRLGFWGWQTPGVYYGVPLVNFMGWVISGGIAMAGMLWLMRRYGWRRPPFILALNLAAIVGFWSLVNLFAGQWLPAGVGLALLVIFFKLRLRGAVLH